MPINFRRVSAFTKMTMNMVMDATTSPIEENIAPSMLNVLMMSLNACGCASSNVCTRASSPTPRRSSASRTVSGAIPFRTWIETSSTLPSLRPTMLLNCVSTIKARSAISSTFDFSIPFTVTSRMTSPTRMRIFEPTPTPSSVASPGVSKGRYCLRR